MTLRARLLITSLAVVVPLAVLLFVIDDRLRGADQLERLTEFSRAEIASGVYDRCVDNGGMRGRPPRGGGPGRGRGGGPEGRDGNPDRFPPPPPPFDQGPPPEGRGGRIGRPGAEGRPYDLLSYGADFTPSSPDLPPLDSALQTALGSADSASGPFTGPEGRGTELAVWLNHADTRCAVLLLRLPPRRGELRDRIVAMGLILFSVIAATWLAAGPVLRRLGKLADSVRQSADTRYETPVHVDGGDEVAVLATAFNDAGGRVRAYLLELQQREDSLRQFVANTAHDVGLPLTVLQGHLADLGARTATSDADTALLHSAMQEAHYLGSLIRNLNAATRLDAVNTPLERHEVGLNTLVERVVARHRVVARARGVELNYAVPETQVVAMAEVTLLEQAVGNLVENAIRYNSAGGHVAIVLDTTDRGFTMTVIDDGPGVREEDLARLTERWFRADDARTRRPDGQGLGLAIASESIKRLGFTLAFSRPPDGGLQAQISG